MKVERIKEKKVLPKNQSIFSEKYMRKFNAGDYVSFTAFGDFGALERIFGLIQKINFKSYEDRGENTTRRWAVAEIVCNDLSVKTIDLCWLRLESKNVSQ